MRLLEHLDRLIIRLSKALDAKDRRAAKKAIFSIRESARLLSEYVFRHDVSVYKKEEYLEELKTRCAKIANILRHHRCAVPPLLMLDLIGELYKAGCLQIFEEFMSLIMDTLRGELDWLARLADILIECGCMDIASRVLLELLEKKYNVRAVLINLAIVSYLLGKPRVAKRYADLYEAYTKRRLKLRKSLAIVLGEIPESYRINILQ